MSWLFAIFAYAALSVGLCSTAVAQAVVIGAKEFTEQLLVAEMTAQLLRASGLSPHKGTGFATTGVRTLQERGIVDVYWEYTGTSLTTFNHVTEKLSDRGFFPSYILAPVVRKTTLERFPQIKAPLEKLSGQLNNETMAALNAAVDLQGRRVEDVASDFLRSRALLSGP